MGESELRDGLGKADPRVVGARYRVVRASPESAGRAAREPFVFLTAAMAAAARAAAACPHRASLAETKLAVDDAATRAAEEVMGAAPFRLEVTAGEGVRDASAGAVTGQSIGATGSADVWHGVFDYVDGTTLAARSLPGALSLGAIGRGFRSVPDLQAYAVLAPVGALDGFDLMSPPEEHAAAALARVSAHTGRALSDMTVVTHSVDSHRHHDTLIRSLRDTVGEVIIPSPVIVEPPYLLSLTGLSPLRVDAMIGAIGLSELAFCAALVDLVDPEYEFVFRMASIDGQRRRPAQTLDPLFEFSDAERAQLAGLGWETDRQYRGADIVAPGTAEVAAVFAVTGNAILSLPAPRSTGPSSASTGLVLHRGGEIAEVVVEVGTEDAS